MSSPCASGRSPASTASLSPAEAAEPAEVSSPALRQHESQRGRIPNLYWRAGSWEQLRAHPRFTGLPPRDAVSVTDSSSLSFLRQGTAEWWQHHSGRVTSSCLLAALGAREAGAARRLGLPAAAASRRHAVSAASRLAEPLHPFLESGEEASAVLARNEAAVSAFNQAGLTAPPPPQTQPAPPSPPSSRRPRPRIVPATTPSLSFPPGPPPELRAQCVSAASGGEQGVRLAWGTANEPGALFALLAAFPECQLREVGLCVPPSPLPPALAALLPAAAQRSLPPLGASPDAMLCWPAGSQYAPPPPPSDFSAVSDAPFIWEVVEIKSRCPFRSENPSSTKGPGVFLLSDRGPPDAMPEQHVPQLQLEMHCTGTRSALLVCDSASKGMAIYRLQRDDDYIALMLRLLALFCAQHVEPGRAGGVGWPTGRAELFGSGPAAAQQTAWLARTRALARNARMLDFITEPRRAPGLGGPWLK